MSCLYITTRHFVCQVVLQKIQEVRRKKLNRSILHCDMNNFYASVECMLDPSLRKYPVAVCGSVEERHGIVLAKNYAAKSFDVKTGDAVWQAKQKCKDLVVVPPHYEEYIKYSKLARNVYSRYTDQVEPYTRNCSVTSSKISISYSVMQMADRWRAKSSPVPCRN